MLSASPDGHLTKACGGRAISMFLMQGLPPGVGGSCAPPTPGVKCLSLHARLDTNMRSEEHSAFIRGKVVAICEAILKEEIGIIAGSRMLKSLGYELCGDHDEDFITFVAIDSETDHLPVDRERGNWSSEALGRKDKEIAEAEAFHRNSALAACKILIERFEMKGSIQLTP